MLKVTLCVHCGIELSPAQKTRQNHCGQVNCQQASVRLFHANKKTKNNELKQSVRTLCEQQRLTSNFDSNKRVSTTKQNNNHISVILLPANTNNVAELSEVRKTNFLTRLSTLYDAIEQNTPMENYPYSLQVEPDNDEPTEHDLQLAQACATCKGYCCLLGGDHGFQDVVSLQLYLKSQADNISKDELLQQFRQYLPIESCSSGCIFQQANGCALPRKMRSLTCNRYSCHELKEYKQRLTESDEKITYAGAVFDNKVVRTRLITKQ
jgi:hypothetical protein